jgi:hypothetical protein
MTLLRGLGIALLALLVAAGIVLVGARFADGPLGPIPGGPLAAGERLDAARVDWSFARDARELELQLVEPARSRTTWLVVHDGVLYVPAGYMRSGTKRWPQQALRDGRVVLRVEGRLVERQAVRVTDPEVREAVVAQLLEKYELPPGEGTGPDDLWIFRMDPRPGAER